MVRPQFTMRRLFATVALIGIGLVPLIEGFSITDGDRLLIAFAFIMFGLSAIGAGVGVLFGRPLLFALATPLVLWILSYVVDLFVPIH